MTMDIQKLSVAYIRQGLMVTVALALIAFLVMQVKYLDLLTPVIVSVAFSFVVCVSIALIWRRVAQRSADSLPSLRRCQASVCCWRWRLCLSIIWLILRTLCFVSSWCL